MTSREVKEKVALNCDQQAILEEAVNSLQMSMRSLQRLLKVTRTIADLEGSDPITDDQPLRSPLLQNKVIFIFFKILFIALLCTNFLHADLLFDENHLPSDKLLQLLEIVGMDTTDKSSISKTNEWAQKHIFSGAGGTVGTAE